MGLSTLHTYGLYDTTETISLWRANISHDLTGSCMLSDTQPKITRTSHNPSTRKTVNETACGWKTQENLITTPLHLWCRLVNNTRAFLLTWRRKACLLRRAFLKLIWCYALCVHMRMVWCMCVMCLSHSCRSASHVVMQSLLVS